MYTLCLAVLVLGFAASRHISPRHASEAAACICKGVYSSRLLCTVSGPSDVVNVKDGYCKNRIRFMELRFLNHTHLSSKDIPNVSVFHMRIEGENLKQVSKNAFVDCEDLSIVEIKKTALREMPTLALRRLHRLQTLIMPDNAIEYIDCSLKDVNLKLLSLFYNQISTVYSCAFPSNLSALVLKNNHLKSLNGSLKHHRILQTIYLESNRITSLQGELDGLDNLSSLDASRNRIEVIGTTPVSLLRLATLVLSHNRIYDLGDSLNGFVNLQSLDLSNNDLESLKAQSFANLAKLGFLTLSGNSIRTLEDRVFEPLSGLETLIISENEITVIDGKLDGLKSLKKLDAQRNNIMAIGNAFKDLTSLEHLDLSYNSINYLGDGLHTLLQLKSLHLTFNRIEEVKKTHFRGNKLEILDLSYNNVQRLNGTIFASLPNLTTLDLSHNLAQRLQDLMVPGFMGIKIESNSMERNVSKESNQEKCHCKPRKVKTLRMDNYLYCRPESDLAPLIAVLEENGIELIGC